MAIEAVRIDGPAAWRGRDLASPDWVRTLSPETLDEIGAALERLRRRGATLADVGIDDFVLPSFATTAAAIRDDLARGRRFAVLRGLPVETCSEADIGMIFWGIGAQFGRGMPQSHLGDRLGHVIDLSDEEAAPRVYHAGGALDMHTDSCDVVALLCLRTARSGGASRIASAMEIHNRLLAADPRHLDVFYEGFRYRIMEADARAAGRPPLVPYRVPVYRRTNGWLNCYFIRPYIERAIAAGDVELSRAERAALDAFDAIAGEPGLCLEMMFEPGDVQFLNNRAVLHGRTDYEDHPAKSQRRHLLRLWLTMPDWPRIADVQSVHSEHDKGAWAARAAGPAD